MERNIKNIYITKSVCCVAEMAQHYKSSILQLKKNSDIIPFAATWMDLEIIKISEVSQTKIQMNLFTRQKQSHRKVEGKNKLRDRD